MAKTITDDVTVNWGSNGVGSGVRNSSWCYDLQPTSFTCKHTVSNSNAYRILYLYLDTITGKKNCTLESIVANFTFKSSNGSNNIAGIWGLDYIGTNAGADDIAIATKTGLGTSDTSVKLSATGEQLLYDSENKRYVMLLGAYRSAITTFYWYFSNVSFYITYTYTAYTLTVNSNNTAYGTVSGGGDYGDGETATLTATPKTGYRFVKWSDGNTSATRTVTVSADATYTATFELITYTATFKNYDGTVLETKSVSQGSTPSYTGATPTRPATAQYIYTFSGWSPALTAITGDTTYTAQFTSTVRSYAITANAETGGKVTGGGNYNYGSTATLTATADEGYRFKQWSDGNTSNPRSVSVTGSATYTAIFEQSIINNIYHSNKKVKGIYTDGSTIAFVVDGTITADDSWADTVDGLHIIVTNSVPANMVEVTEVYASTTKIYG